MVLSHVVTTAPGKIILSGEHAVVYGTEAVACAIDIRTTCTGKLVDHSTKLHVSFGDLIQKEWEIADVNKAIDESGSLHEDTLQVTVTVTVKKL